MSIPSDFFAALDRIEQHREQTRAEGLPALERLAAVARHDSGQAQVVGLFLLGLYNAHAYPFSLTQLRGLDLDLHNDCLAVLRLDYHPTYEIHQYIEGGDELLSHLCETLGKVEVMQ